MEINQILIDLSIGRPLSVSDSKKLYRYIKSCISREQADQLLQELSDSVDFWSSYKDTPLVRDILSTVHQYCDPKEEN